MTGTNYAIVVRWFTRFWGCHWNPAIVDELGSSDIRLRAQNCELSGRSAVLAFMTELREAFHDLHFRIVGDLVAEDDRVACRWDGGGTHKGAAFHHYRLGAMPVASGRMVLSSGTTMFRIRNGLIAEEQTAEDAMRAMQPLGNLARLLACA